MPTVNLEADLNRAPINVSPSPIPGSIADQSLTFGDMHGNAIKLIYLLVQNGVMNLNKEDYHSLKMIYDLSNDELTPDDLVEFERLLNKATYNKCGMVRLIGDELADRGKNDYFTLCIMRTLQEKQIPFEITLSNHSVIALREFDPGEPQKDILGKGLQASLKNMWRMFDRPGFEHKREEALRIANEVYKPHLLLIGYNIQTDESGQPLLNLYTHAPVGLETIKELASKFGVDYDDSSIEALTRSIDEINGKAKAAIAQGTFSNYFDGHNMPRTGPLYELFWARTLQQSFTLVPAQTAAKKFKVVVTHGHVGPADSHPEVQHEGLINLDNDLGKGYKVNKGAYPVQFEIHQPKPLIHERHSTPAQPVQNLSTPKQEQPLTPPSIPQQKLAKPTPPTQNLSSPKQDHPTPERPEQNLSTEYSVNQIIAELLTKAKYDRRKNSRRNTPFKWNEDTDPITPENLAQIKDTDLENEIGPVVRELDRDGQRKLCALDTKKYFNLVYKTGGYRDGFLNDLYSSIGSLHPTVDVEKILENIKNDDKILTEVLLHGMEFSKPEIFNTLVELVIKKNSMKTIFNIMEQEPKLSATLKEALIKSAQAKYTDESKKNEFEEMFNKMDHNVLINHYNKFSSSYSLTSFINSVRLKFCSEEKRAIKQKDIASEFKERFKKRMSEGTLKDSATVLAVLKTKAEQDNQPQDDPSNRLKP